MLELENARKKFFESHIETSPVLPGVTFSPYEHGIDQRLSKHQMILSKGRTCLVGDDTVIARMEWLDDFGLYISNLSKTPLATLKQTSEHSLEVEPAIPFIASRDLIDKLPACHRPELYLYPPAENRPIKCILSWNNLELQSTGHNTFRGTELLLFDTWTANNRQIPFRPYINFKELGVDLPQTEIQFLLPLIKRIQVRFEEVSALHLAA